MNPEKYAGLSPEQKEMMEQATFEPTEKEKARAEYSDEERIVAEAFESLAEEDPILKAAVEKLEKMGTFSGRGDVYEQILKVVEAQKERGLGEDELRQMARKMARQRLQRFSEKRAA